MAQTDMAPRPFTLSYSGMQDYLDCKSYFYARKVLNLPSIETKAQISGRLFHEMIEKRLTNGVWPEAASVFVNSDDAMVADLNTLTKLAEDVFQVIGMDLLEGGQKERKIALDYELKPVEWGAPKQAWRAVLDVLCLEERGLGSDGRPIGNHATIIDWKSGHMYVPTMTQGKSYALDVFMYYPSVVSVTVLMVPIRNGPFGIDRFDIDIGMAHEEMDRRDSAFREIFSRDSTNPESWPPTISPRLCPQCPVRSTCPVFKAVSLDDDNMVVDDATAVKAWEYSKILARVAEVYKEQVKEYTALSGPVALGNLTSAGHHNTEFDAITWPAEALTQIMKAGGRVSSAEQLDSMTVATKINKTFLGALGKSVGLKPAEVRSIVKANSVTKTKTKFEARSTCDQKEEVKRLRKLSSEMSKLAHGVLPEDDDINF